MQEGDFKAMGSIEGHGGDVGGGGQGDTGENQAEIPARLLN